MIYNKNSMKGFPKLTIKKILQKHKKNLQDKQLHNTIETKEIEKDQVNILIKESTKHNPFDKK